ncbi:MAG: precorrin-6Y C5,15-methyltransferase (decarboxylating) subunit CbiT [Lachnospiraceae bacterium]|nr:precorrin-6Y C5,15-methyltransferase (decarboxylating) subunit CbiT [Lachnospiraceae bacterium]
MSNIVLFAGTTEGRKLSEWLSSKKMEHIICVATKYGEQVLEENTFSKIHTGRMDESDMETFFKANHTDIVVDATHPYADLVTKNLKSVTQKMNIEYLRLDRDSLSNDVENKTGKEADSTELNNKDLYSKVSYNTESYNDFEIRYFPDNAECEKTLKNTEGNILLTTGSKELSNYCITKSVKDRLTVRVIPSIESLKICTDLDIKGKQIIAMQGPFSMEMNLALINQYGIKVLVTKASGSTGGFEDKLDAAKLAGIKVFVIGRCEGKKGLSFAEVKELLKNKIKSEQINKQKRTITLVGCGMGQRGEMSGKALKVIENADIVFGAKRLLDGLDIKNEKYPYYLAEDIVPVLERHSGDAAILFSGDTGFYSGCKKLYKIITDLVEQKKINAEVKIIPGISSVSNLSALTGISWDDAKIISLHGAGNVDEWKKMFLTAVKNNKKCFALLSGVKDMNSIGKILVEEGLSEVSIVAGYQMSCENQKLVRLTPKECMKLKSEGLYSIFVLSQGEDEIIKITTGIKDEEFIRGIVPMTKEEVRTVSISKMNLLKDSVVYDIGSGTGSVAVEIARLSEDIKVFAIEKKSEGIELIEKNKSKFGLDNIEVIEGMAPEAMEDLPIPSHAFIGGSSGNMSDIVKSLIAKNPEIRIVANAVSLETLKELMMLENEFTVSDFDVVNVSITKTEKLGNYHMMRAQNPVYICSFKGRKED